MDSINEIYVNIDSIQHLEEVVNTHQSFKNYAEYKVFLLNDSSNKDGETTKVFTIRLKKIFGRKFRSFTIMKSSENLILSLFTEAQVENNISINDVLQPYTSFSFDKLQGSKDIELSFSRYDEPKSTLVEVDVINAPKKINIFTNWFRIITIITVAIEVSLMIYNMI